VPLSLDTSLAFRPDLRADPGSRAFDTSTTAERAEFASTLARARATEGAAPARSAEPTLVAPTRTRLTGSEAAGALRAAWTEVRGRAPSQETLSLLVGQWAHETGRGASMRNFNFGGLKGTGPSGLSATCSTREGWGDGEVRVNARFRAYGTAEEGARDYVSLLARRYPEAVSAAEQGDAKGFVTALKANGYFTDNEATYLRSVQSLANRALLAGFDAIGCEGAPGVDAAAAPQLAQGGADALPAPLSLPMLLDGGALLEGPRDLGGDAFAGLSIPQSAFTDEVSRAALLMSALHISEPGRAEPNKGRPGKVEPGKRES
jgi:mannosyl-glycoprotein endo-beta-N-acetylglucosaminidase